MLDPLSTAAIGSLREKLPEVKMLLGLPAFAFLCDAQVKFWEAQVAVLDFDAYKTEDDLRSVLREHRAIIQLWKQLKQNAQAAASQK